MFISRSFGRLAAGYLAWVALEFQGLLDDGVVNNRADIARRHGISRARVTQVLSILRMPKTALVLLQGLAAESRVRCTERCLRSILLLLTEAARLTATDRLRQQVGAG